MRNLVSSVAEAETCGIFHNTQIVVPIGQILIAPHHSQPHIPIKTDNTTALRFTYNNIQFKSSKRWDMKLNWLRDKKHQKQFELFWEMGDSEDNLHEVDY